MRTVIVHGKATAWDEYVDSVAREGLESVREELGRPAPTARQPPEQADQ